MTGDEPGAGATDEEANRLRHDTQDLESLLRDTPGASTSTRTRHAHPRTRRLAIVGILFGGVLAGAWLWSTFSPWMAT